MRFRDIIYSELYDIEPFSKFIRKAKIESEPVMIEYREEDLEEIRRLYKSSATELMKSFCINERTVVGSDNRVYILSDDSIIKQNMKMSFSLRKPLRFLYKNYKKHDKYIKYAEKRIAGCGKTHSISRPSVSSFRAYEYIDKENGVCFNYRLRACKKKNMPVVIYFHGGGALGRNNMKQLLEFRLMGGGLSRRKATVLLPQAHNVTNGFINSDIMNYLMSVRKLTDTVVNQVGADKSRISIVGTSFGGCCVWQMIWNYPEYFSCAVPVMGSLPECWNNRSGGSIDMNKLKEVPIWVAHAADDTNVKIDDDDFCVKRLREIGSNVKYSRWEKYGHRMSVIFYRREKWVDWMLSHSLENRETKPGYEIYEKTDTQHSAGME